MIRTIPSSLALALMLAVQVTRAAEETEKPTLHGSWKVVSAEKNGAEAVDPIGDQVVFEGDRITIKPKNSNKKAKEGTFTSDPAVKPATLDIKPPRGEMVLAIYEVSGDRLRICFSKEGGARPSDLATKADAGLTLMVLEREKQK